MNGIIPSVAATSGLVTETAASISPVASSDSDRELLGGDSYLYGGAIGGPVEPLQSVAPEIIPGQFAAPDQTAQTRGYCEIMPIHARGGTAQRMWFWTTPLHSNDPITAYKTSKAQAPQLLMVDDTFSQFARVTPNTEPDGRFTIDQDFPHGGIWHVYSLATPDHMTPQAFRYDIAVDSPLPPGTDRQLAPLRSGLPTLTDSSGPYEARISGNEIAANQNTTLRLDISTRGNPARGLSPTAGAAAQVILLNTRDLSMVRAQTTAAVVAHDHVTPHIGLHVHLPEPGDYRMWVQFSAPAGLQTVSFPITSL